MSKTLISRSINWLYLCLLMLWLSGFSWFFLTQFVRPDFFCRYFLDFTRFFAAASLMVSPDRLHLYDVVTQYHWLSKTMEPMGCGMPANYSLDAKALFFSEQPPPFLLFFVPFTLLPLKAAFISNMLICFLVGAAGVFALATRINRLSAVQAALIIFGGLSSGISCYGLQLGQPDWLILGLVALATLFLLRGNDVAGAFALAFLSMKPQYLVFLLLPPLMLRRWRLVVYTLVVCLGILAVSAALLGWQTILHYPVMLLSQDTRAGFQSVMVGFRGILDWFMPRTIATIVAAAATVFGLTVVATAWLKMRHNEQKWALCMSLTVVASLLFGPHNFRYDCMLIAVPAALLLPALSLPTLAMLEKPAMRWLATTLVLYPILTMCFMYVVLDERWRTVLFFVVHAVMFLSLAWLVWGENGGISTDRTVSSVEP